MHDLGARLQWGAEGTDAAASLLATDPAAFVRTHGPSMLLHEARALRAVANTTTSRQTLGRLCRELTPKATVRNRRYTEMLLRRESGFFSLAAIQTRAPELYALYVGRYEDSTEADLVRQTRRDLLGTSDDDDLPPSTQHAPPARTALFGAMQDLEDDPLAAFMKPMGCESAEGLPPARFGEMEDGAEVMAFMKPMGEGDGGGVEEATEEERQANEVELVSVMEARFLCGEDEAVDYTQVDADEAHDDVAQYCIDAEESYFAEDSSRSGGSFAANLKRFADAPRAHDAVDRSAANNFGF